MIETSRDWSEKLPFALWAYRTSFHTSTGATPYSLVYDMEVVLPVEIEMGSLSVTLEQQISEVEWVQSRLDQLSLLDERRLRAVEHIQAYQRKMARAFKKRVKPRPLQRGDLVLRVLRGLVTDPRGKFKPNWSGPYIIREFDPRGSCMVDGLRWKPILRANQCGSTEKVLRLRPWSQDGWPSFRLAIYLITCYSHFFTVASPLSLTRVSWPIFFSYSLAYLFIPGIGALWCVDALV